MKTKTLFSIIFYFISVAVIAQPGTLDNDFSADGKLSFHFFNNTPDTAYALQIQPDRKILVAGSTDNGTETVGAIARIDEYGNFDVSFGGSGKVVVDFPGVSEHITIKAMAVQSDGKIVVAGSYQSTLANTFFVARFLANGIMDSTFSTHGYVLTGFGSGPAHALCLALQTDHKIVVGGTSFNSVDNDFAMARYLPNGTLDSTFHGDGKVTTNGILTGGGSTSDDFVTGINIQTNNTIIATGYATPNYFFSHDYFALLKYTANGNLDITFDGDGKFLFDADGRESKTYCSVQLDDGSILLGGSANDSFAVAKVSQNGVIDSSFGQYGIAIHTSGNFTLQHVNGLAVQSDGKILAAGFRGNTSSTGFIVLRLKSTGEIDSTFGVNGFVNHGFGAGSQGGRANAVKIQADGRILAVGLGDPNPDSEFAIARYHSGLNLGLINFSCEQKTVAIYPNPVAEYVNLKFSLAQNETISIRLFDMQGRLVATLIENESQREGEIEKKLNIPAWLPGGDYLVSLVSKSGNRSVKLIKL